MFSERAARKFEGATIVHIDAAAVTVRDGAVVFNRAAADLYRVVVRGVNTAPLRPELPLTVPPLILRVAL